MYSRAVTFLVENDVGLSKGTLTLRANTDVMVASLGLLFGSTFILYLGILVYVLLLRQRLPGS